MIWLVGAGSGDYGLMTLRGAEVLRRADVVIYDRLIGDGILAMIPETAEKIDAGKISGSHKISQTQINELIIENSKSGKNVVRLKGGDVFLFGRGGEEAEAIINAGLKFEVVPGVSSAMSVPAYAGIPVTHRNFCSGVNIYTAHDKNNLIPDFDKNTLIFLMGVAHAKELQEKLLQTLNPETPCAIIENGTTARQRVIRTKLKLLYKSVIENEIKSPAVIVVGEVAELNLDWRKNLPLNGKKILITRPAGRGERLAEMLRDEGAEVILMPTIKTQTLQGSLDGKNLTGYDWIGFTSVTGVESFFELLSESDRDIREIGTAKIAAIGSATEAALKNHGLRVDYVPEIFDVKNLTEGLKKLSGKILLLRALNGVPEKSFFDEICIYKIDVLKLTKIPKIDIVIFTSASTVRGFLLNVKSVKDTCEGVTAVCIGEQTAEEARRVEFFDKIIIAKCASVDAVFDVVMKVFSPHTWGSLYPSINFGTKKNFYYGGINFLS